MHSVAIIFTLINIAAAATIGPLYLEDKEMPKEQSLNEQSTINGAAHLPAQNNNPPPSSHIYPTYPEYLNNNHAVSLRTEYKSYVIPTTAAVQKTSRWSYENIVSSLIPFVTSLMLYSIRAGTLFLRFFVVIFVAAASIGLICTHTSICNIIFPNKTEVKELARMYITPNNLNILTMAINNALDKYNSMQYKKDEEDVIQDK